MTKEQVKIKKEKEEIINTLNSFSKSKVIKETVKSIYYNYTTHELYTKIVDYGYTPCNLEFRQPVKWDIFLDTGGYISVCSGNPPLEPRIILSPLKSKK